MSNDKKVFQVTVSKRATEILVSHAAFLSKISSEKAEQLVVSFESATKSLEKMPYRCPRISYEYMPDRKYRSLLFEKRYLIIFQISGETVFIDYVLDCRQDYDWLLN